MKHLPCVQLLIESFPKCFFEDEAKVRPLKEGLRDEIEKALPGKASNFLARGLKSYTRRPCYLERCVLGAERIDLEGKVAGTIDEEAVAFAKKRLRNTLADEEEAKKNRDHNEELRRTKPERKRLKREAYEKAHAEAREKKRLKKEENIRIQKEREEKNKRRRKNAPPPVVVVKRKLKF